MSVSTLQELRFLLGSGQGNSYSSTSSENLFPVQLPKKKPVPVTQGRLLTTAH